MAKDQPKAENKGQARKTEVQERNETRKETTVESQPGDVQATPGSPEPDVSAPAE